jgi:hypothetical protein
LHAAVQGPDCHKHSIKNQNPEIALKIGRFIMPHRIQCKTVDASLEEQIPHQLQFVL